MNDNTDDYFYSLKKVTGLRVLYKQEFHILFWISKSVYFVRYLFPVALDMSSTRNVWNIYLNGI
jgi:hypothetical protein